MDNTAHNRHGKALCQHLLIQLPVPYKMRPFGNQYVRLFSNINQTGKHRYTLSNHRGHRRALHAHGKLRDKEKIQHDI